MPDAYVLNRSITASDKSQLDQNLINSGFRPIHSFGSFVPTISITADVYIVILPVDSSEISAVTNEATRLARMGGRVVGVWLLSASGSLLPTFVKNLGYSAICINSLRFDDVIKGICPSWENSNCLPRETQDVLRHKC